MEDQSVPDSFNQPVNCFICDDKVTRHSVRLMDEQTQHTKSVFPLKIEQIMGEGFVVIVSNEDTVCERCSHLVNLFDKLQSDLETVQTKLKNFLNIKYQLDSFPDTTENICESVLDSNSIPTPLPGTPEHEFKIEPLDILDESPSVRVYKCKYCSYMTDNKLLLKRHLKSHNKKIVYKCSLCRISYNSRVEIEEHINVVHGTVSPNTNSSENADVISSNKTRNISRTFKCGLCFVTYSTKEELIVHFDTHRSISNRSRIHSSNDKQVSNNIIADCDNDIHSMDCEIDTGNIKQENIFSFNNSTPDGHSSNVADHIVESDYGNKYHNVANNAGDSFYTVNYEYVESDLLSELRGRFQFVEAASDVQCHDISSVTVLSQTSLQDKSNFDINSIPTKIKIENESSRVKIYVCSICNSRSSSEFGMKRHIKSHIAQSNKVFTCHICGKGLTTGSNLKRHINNHTSNPINCEICHEMLTDRLHLKQHMETKHPQTYCCSACGEMLKSKQQLRTHDLMHKGATHFKCEYNGCTDVFLKELELKNHQSLDHGILYENLGSKIYKCYICHKLLTTFHNLKRHLLIHKSSNMGTLQCSLCKQEVTNKIRLKQHYEVCHPEVFPCGFCSEIFLSKQACKVHEETHPERLFYKCTVEGCEKVFPNERQLKRHIAITHREPQCQYCSKEISDMKKLIDHERRHERNKQKFPCPECGRVFQTPTGRRYHMSLHTGQYNFHCDVCNKGFNSEVILAEHKATHTKEIRYTCDRCGRNFSANSTYRLHRLWHDNPFPYTCNICNRKFRHTSILSVHKRRAHTGERPYKCPHCPFTFNIGSTLNKHLILHTKEYPHVCRVCSKGFTTRAKIAKHMEKAHHDSSMINQKRKPCEYKMVLRPDEYVDNQVSTKSIILEDDPEEENSPPDAENDEKVDIASVSSSHPVFNMF